MLPNRAPSARRRSSSWRRRAFSGGSPKESETQRRIAELEEKVDALQKRTRRGRTRPSIFKYQKLLEQVGLTEKQQNVFYLRFAQGLSVSEIARRLRRHRKTVQEQLQRIAVKLSKKRGLVAHLNREVRETKAD
jgi:DNA-binding NarL/FixJ family response regulator